MLLGEHSSSLRKATVIVNAEAGTGGDAHLPERIQTALTSLGWEVTLLRAAKSAPPDRLAREAISQGAQILIGSGGDGTISAVASAVAGTGATLGVLPTGTLNHFAKDLQIPLALDAAIAVIDRGKVANVDVGEVNNRVFINNSSLGLYPNMIFERLLQQRSTGRSKWIAVLSASLTVFRRFRSARVRLVVDGQPTRRKTPFVFIGNNEYRIGGFEMGTRARLDEGQLSLYIAQPASRLRVIWLSLLALFGHLRTAKDFEGFLLTETSIETRGKHVRVSLDGELAMMQNPLHYRSRPSDLRVFVP